jgi:hypothetical protein
MSSSARRRILTALLLVLVGGVSAGIARGEEDPPYALYQLGAPDFTREEADALAKRLKLKVPKALPTAGAPGAAVSSDITLYLDKKQNLRLSYDTDGGRLQLYTDLTDKSLKALSAERSFARANEFLKTNALLPDQEVLSPGEFVVLATQPATLKKGELKTGPKRDVLGTARFQRTLDGLPVFGPSSIVLADVARNGVVGLTRSFRPTLGRSPVEIISAKQASDRFQQEFGAHLQQLYGDNQPQVNVQGPELIYYEQGHQYIQPGYRFFAELTSDAGTRSSFIWVVPAVDKTPEAIENVPPLAQDNIPSEPEEGQVHAATAARRYGMYVVREDYSGWLEDAYYFGRNLRTGNYWYRVGHSERPEVTEVQYLWNRPWFWHAFDSVPDLSASYIGTVDLAIIEGHGAPWQITTLQNNGDIIDLRNIAGYGGNNGRGGQTDYIVWQGCGIIPAPGDPYGGYYAAPNGPFSVWFQIFRGMRGNFGYRTTIHVYNNAGKFFGYYAGVGHDALSAWFISVNGNAYGHANGWNYANAVVLAGQEGATIYDNTRVANPGGLSMWWQY